MKMDPSIRQKLDEIHDAVKAANAALEGCDFFEFHGEWNYKKFRWRFYGDKHQIIYIDAPLIDASWSSKREAFDFLPEFVERVQTHARYLLNIEEKKPNDE